MQSSTVEATDDSALSAMIPHLPTILLQRKWLFIIPALVGLIIGVAAAYLLPVVYQSKATLIVEAPLLPEEIAGDVSGEEMIDQRMARIRQQVLSRTQLIDIINRNSLYQTELRTKTFSDVIEQMRGEIAIEPVTAGIQTSRRGAQRGTIAFSISYNYSDPIKAQAVLQALTQQIQEINSNTQSQQAANTVQFLTDQSEELQQQIAQLEGTILSIKSSNGTALSGTGAFLGSPQAIQSQILSLEQANATLRAQRDLLSTASQRDPGVQQAEANLAALRATYAETHPDVALAKQRLAEAKRLAQTREAELPVDRASTVDSQIAFNNSQISSLRAAMNMATSSLAAASQAPALQEQINQLQARLSGLQTQYQRAQTQLNAARAGKRADDEQQGERLRLLESPSTPEKPISPNRPLLITAGLGAGLGLGILIILALEVVHRPIRHIATVTNTVGEPPLVVIPTIRAPGEQKMGFFSRFFSGGKDDDDDDD